MIFSLPKLLGLFALIWLVWVAFRFFEARQKKNDINQDSGDGKGKSPSEAGMGENGEDAKSIDLQECDVCGAWVISETCERENCPY